MDPDQRDMEAMDGRAKGNVTPKKAANSISAQDTVDKTIPQPASSKQTESRKHTDALTPSSSGRKRSARVSYKHLVSYDESESDDRDESQIHSIPGSTRGVATRTRKRNTTLFNNDEDSSYEPEIQDIHTLGVRKIGAQSASMRTRSKIVAKDMDVAVSKQKRQTVHPKDHKDKEATKAFYIKQGVDQRRELKVQATELEKKDQELEQLRGAKAELQNQLKAMDDAVMCSRSVHKLVRRDDSVVRDELQAFTTECRNWAIEWSHQDPPSEKMSVEDRNALFEVFFGQSPALGGARPMLREGFNELWSDRNGAAILLQTFLTHSIAANILAEPFRLLLGNGGEDGSRSEFWVVLTAVYKSISEANEAEGSAWRAQTLKLLDRCIKELETVLEQNVADNFQGSRDRLCVSSAMRICRLGAIQGLFRPRSDAQMRNCREELFGIFQKSISLFRRLWVQDVDIHRWGVSAGDMQRPFHNDDDTMSPHPVMRLKPGDTSLDGRKILVVVQPAILAIELKSLATQRLEKVWLKALVYMSRQKQQPRPEHGKAPTGDIVANTSDNDRSDINEQRIGTSHKSDEESTKGQATISQVARDNETTHVDSEAHAHQASGNDVGTPNTVIPKIPTPTTQEFQAKTLPEEQIGQGENPTAREHEEDEPPAKRRRLDGVPVSEGPEVNAVIGVVSRNGAMSDTSSRYTPTNEKSREARDAEKARKVVKEFEQNKARWLADKGLMNPE